MRRRERNDRDARELDDRGIRERQDRETQERHDRGTSERHDREAVAGRGEAEGEPSAFEREVSGGSRSEPVHATGMHEAEHVPVLSDEVTFLLRPAAGAGWWTGRSAWAATPSSYSRPRAATRACSA